MFYSVMKLRRTAGQRGSKPVNTLTKLSTKLPMCGRNDEMKETAAYNSKTCDFMH